MSFTITRPWKMNEVPVGKIVRFKCGDHKWCGVITGTEPTYLIHISNSPMVFTPSDALTLLQYCDSQEPTTDRRWKPCGVEEGAT